MTPSVIGSSGLEDSLSAYETRFGDPLTSARPHRTARVPANPSTKFEESSAKGPEYRNGRNLKAFLFLLEKYNTSERGFNLNSLEYLGLPLPPLKRRPEITISPC